MDGHHSYKVPPYDTTALTSALADPYAQRYAPHYYQAYVRAHSHRTTADGYTLSSTYAPSTASQTSRTTPSAQAWSQTTMKPTPNRPTHGSWYQPGNCRCTRQGCPFTGSRKAVEVHMMDRHFIFPLGWKKQDEWDADPTLKGKPIAIQGTSLVLDTPEAVGAWIAERKRRFPTDENVRDKRRKLEEAAARGQLTPEDIGTGTRKRSRRNTVYTEVGGKRLRRQKHQSGRWQGPEQCEAPQGDNLDGSTSRPAGARTGCVREPTPNSGSITDEDEAPEEASSKHSIAPLCTLSVNAGHSNGLRMPHVDPQGITRRVSQPKKPPRNPFASRSTLLRNLILPEIRVTVSNLSQAIRFLVENDLLRDVELRPGEAQEQKIEVLESSETSCSAQSATEKPLHPRPELVRYAEGKETVDCVS